MNKTYFRENKFSKFNKDEVDIRQFKMNVKVIFFSPRELVLKKYFI